MPPQPPSAASRDEPVIRDRGDACPGALRLHAADDGYLARVRIPGGLLTTRQAVALGDAADRFGDGHLELTSRGNVQLRGLAEGCGGGLAELLDGAGLLPAPSHERVRNIVATPVAGPQVVGWVRELDRLLCASARAAELSGRFLFALDDGRGDVAALDPDVTVLARGPEAARGPGSSTDPDGAAVPAGPVGPRGSDGLDSLDGFGGRDGRGGGDGRGGRGGRGGRVGLNSPGGPDGRGGRDRLNGPHGRLNGPEGRGGLDGFDGCEGREGREGRDGGGRGGFDGLDGRGGLDGFGGCEGLNSRDGGGLDGRGGPDGPGGPKGAGGSGGSGAGAEAGVGSGGGRRALVRLGAGRGAVEVAAVDAARAALCAAEYFLDVVGTAGTRAWRVAELPPEHALDEREFVRRLADAGIAARHVPEVAWPYAEPPRPGRVGAAGLCVLPPLGRVGTAQWRVLAEATDGGELRVTPWRSLVLPRADADGAARIEAAGLVVRPESPWRTVTACTGKPGCAKSLADVRADARAVVREQKAAGELPVHWSGCARRCGHPRGTAWADLVATPDGYELDGRPVPHADLAAALTAARTTPTTTEAAVKK
nr:nitrite reductase [Streptomyces katrae]